MSNDSSDSGISRNSSSTGNNKHNTGNIINQDLEYILDIIELPVLLLDRNLEVIHYNKAYASAAGLQSAMVAEPLDAGHVQLWSSDSLENPLREALRLQQPIQLARTLGTKFLETTIYPAPWGLLVVGESETKKQEAERMRWELEDELAHAFKTPLTSISGFTETMLSSLDMPVSKRKEILEDVFSQTKKLERIVGDLLFISRFGKHANFLEMDIIDLRIPVFDAARELLSAAEQRGLGVSWDIPIDPIDIRGNESSLKDLAINVIENAIRYTDFGGEIFIAIETQAGEVRLVIRDTGQGIEPSIRDKIFEKFFRSDSARIAATPGAGLGLAKVKRIADAHGCTIAVDSSPDHGSTFTFTFTSPTSPPQE